MAFDDSPSHLTDGPDEVVQEWLAYAREVVRAAAHRPACEAAGGPLDPRLLDAPDLRWPGYLGEDYRSGGTLCVGLVHRDFASANVGTQTTERLVDITRRWRDAEVSDEAYLDIVRQVYRRGLELWNVGRKFSRVLETLDVTLDEIAFTNAAKCQYPQPSDDKRATGRLASACLRTFPLADLVSRLRPSLVLVLPVVAYDSLVPAQALGPLVVGFHQQLGDDQLTRDLALADGRAFPAGTKRAVWAPALAEAGFPRPSRRS